MNRAGYGAAGIGPGRPLSRGPAPRPCGGRLQNSSARSAPYRGGYGGGGGSHDVLPLGHDTAGGAACGGFGGYDGMGRFDDLEWV